MKKINIIKKILIFIFFVLAILYILFLTVLPALFSSRTFLKAIDKIIEKKTGIVITSEKLNVKSFPDLNIKLSADKLNINSEKKELLRVENASLFFDLKTLKTKKADIKYIYLNPKHIKNISGQNKKKKNSFIKFKNIPELKIKKAEIWVNEGDVNSAFFDVNNLIITNENDKTKFTFEAEIISNVLKNLIHIGRKGCIYINQKGIFSENFEVLIGTSSINLDGKIIDNDKKSNFTVKGSDIPISEVMSSLLYFQKLKDKSKKFIENFYDYSGKLQIDLKINEKGVFGVCTAVNLGGKTVFFDVPVLFKYVPFKFNGREFSTEANGILGGENVYASFNLKNLAQPNQESQGSVFSVLTNKSINKYVPHASVKGEVKALVNYIIKNKRINVSYKLDIPKNSDIYYKQAYLGVINKHRKLYAQTLKYEDKLKITNYEYEISDEGEKTKIITGEGLFTKQNGHFTGDYITCKTQHNAPVSVAGSFYKYAKGGVFNGDLKYDFVKNKITGNFNIKHSNYQDYFIEEAKVNALDDTVSIEAKGEYKKSPFKASILGLNDFNNKIRIYSLDLFLEEFVVNTKKHGVKPTKINEAVIKEQTDNFDIDLYTVKFNKLKYRKILLNDIFVKGSIKDNIFNFDVPKINFAKGVIKAKGLYDFNKRISDVAFSAENVNSNIAAGLLFNIPGQVEGTANAKFRVKTKNGIDDKYGHLEFFIKQGYFPNLGSTKLIFKYSNKITLDDIINIDIKNINELSSDIEGTFDIYNEKIKNANITSSQKYLSFVLQGDYNIFKQDADLELYGKYNNKEISRIKVLFIPLSVVIKIFFRNEKTKEKYKNKLELIPDITAKDCKDISNFRIFIKGNVNQNNMKVEMKSII